MDKCTRELLGFQDESFQFDEDWYREDVIRTKENTAGLMPAFLMFLLLGRIVELLCIY